MTTPFQKIEAAARASTSNDSDSINALTDAVLDVPHVFQVPLSMRALVAQRLTSAEIRYRVGKQQGVSEVQLVDLMNRIGKKLPVPDESLLTLPQLRIVRMGLALDCPIFMKKEDDDLAALSPLQSVQLFFTIIDQKAANDDFSDPVTDPQILLRTRQQEMEDIRREHPTQKGIVMVKINPKGAAFKRAVIASANDMSLADVNMTSDGLNSLGF